MKNIVLIHGAWHGGWVWQKVATKLRRAGHSVFTPTLTGLGERQHLIQAVDGPDVHVDDVVNLASFRELDNVVLVGHSYGGMIAASAATILESCSTHLVLLDALVPEKAGQSHWEIASDDARFTKELLETSESIPPTGFHRWAASKQHQQWLADMTTPHPASTFVKGVSRLKHPSTLKLERSYILCTRHTPSPFEAIYERLKKDPRWDCFKLDCLHDAMVDKPTELAGLICRIVDSE
ncbi:MAG: alpha/beta hydrolase [Gammaproteobacteria bacterium]|nr:alpha/beta hydrolase [Gammaproteobacteria bacterium]